MTSTLKEMIDEFPPNVRKEIIEETDRLHAEYLTLEQLRKAKRKTQTQIAEELNMSQASVSKIEKRSDMMISTLRKVIEAMGGELRLSVSFPGNAPIDIQVLKDTEEFPEKKVA